MIKAIETVYNGYRFRSRLEARWAVFFDALGVKYEYEVEGYDLGDDGWYLPDFWLPDFSIWVEIKGVDATEDEKRKAFKLSTMAKKGVMLIVGSPGLKQEGKYFTQKDYEMMMFAGECHDTYDSIGCFISDFYSWSPWHFESLRRMLLQQVDDGVLLDSDVSALDEINPFDEMARRKALIETDKIYFRRKYGKEHLHYSWGRHSAVGFKYQGKDLIIVEDHLRFPEQPIVDALVKARQARFEHGQTPEPA